MGRLIIGTNAVSMDEPGFSLKEINLQAANSKGWRRYQHITVVRGDRLAEFRRDLGPVRKFKVDQFCVPGGATDAHTGRIWIEHTVGELMDIADHLREGPFRRPEPVAPSDLIKEYRDLPDKRNRQRRRVSQFGPVAIIQRS